MGEGVLLELTLIVNMDYLMSQIESSQSARLPEIGIISIDDRRQINRSSQPAQSIVIRRKIYKQDCRETGLEPQ
jgi:hypothetical protein